MISEGCFCGYKLVHFDLALETNEEQLAKTNHISPVLHTAHISVL
jgi:hypothetical protein